MESLFSGVVGIIALAALFLAVMLPFFVAAIANRIWKLLQESKQQTELMLKVKAELERSNGLARQLLESYGHKPKC